ncbi:50S ribosomal protein L3 [Candidatus Woesearchaeota archaeon]|nr:50S ribosomal protein L3 [Candidatus Woesearchaeota archaeon]
MGKPQKPRSGSMGVWPRVRSKRQYARVRSVPILKETKLLAFPAYKAGMTHVMAEGSDKNKRTSKTVSQVPVTILECPPIKIASIRLYGKNDDEELVVVNQLNFKSEKELNRKTNVPKKTFATTEELDNIDTENLVDVSIQIYTQPKIAKLKKTPEIFEVNLSGSIKEKIAWIKDHVDKPVSIQDVFKEGQFVDSHSITTGKGYQGPVKRFGIGLKSHKSEKGVRSVGSLGGWSGQAHVMYRVPHAGQMGYHQRTQFNNFILKISDKPEEVNPQGGIVNYGLLNTSYVLVQGSIPGPKKRLITLTEPIRLNNKKPEFNVQGIKKISTASIQGR